jgi:hypothetical protein
MSGLGGKSGRRGGSKRKKKHVSPHVPPQALFPQHPPIPTARTHPKPTRTYHICSNARERVDPATISSYRFGALEQPLWDLL